MTSGFQKFMSMILCFFMLNFASVTKGNKDPNIETVYNNIYNGLLSGTIGPFSSSDIADADEIVARVEYDADGDAYFPDIDYENGERSSWPAARHIARLEKLALTYRAENDAEKRDTYKNCALKLLDYWIKKDYQNSNWWHNRLSNPNILGEVGILMKEDLSRKQLIKLSELVGRGSFSVTRVLYDHTGANAMELAMSSIKFGALTGNRSSIKKAVKVVIEDLKYAKGEGLKEDHTFFQHGNRIYMGGYGITFVNGLSSVVTLLSGTEYIFTNEQLSLVTSFILDGMRKMSFGDTLDPTVMGRSTSRRNAQPLRGFANTLKKLAQIDEMPRKDELNAYADSIINGTKSDMGLSYFDVSRFLVINNSDFYFSFRGGDNNMLYSEIINNENVLSYNSSFPGVTTVMHTGAEYNNISPIFDYSLVPGTTAVYENDEELRAHADHTNRNLKGVYGSAFDGTAAVSSAQTTHEGVDMTVTCFATDNAAILLGAGMKDAGGREMNTTIDQCFSAGAFERNGNTVVHNGIKYKLYEGGELTAKSEHRTGDWHRNNLTLDNIPAEGDVFTLSFKNTGAYAYSVMSENTNAEFEVIVNTEKVQAVRLPDGRVAAAFFTKTSFTFDGVQYSGKAGEAKIF